MWNVIVVAEVCFSILVGIGGLFLPVVVKSRKEGA